MDAAPSPSWRKRHPVAARLVLYGLGAAVLAGGVWWGLAYRRESSRQALITRLDGIDQTGLTSLQPAEALRIVRDEVLAVASDADVVRRARLTEAAALDSLRRFDDSEAVYAAVDAGLPAGIPRGPIRVPWANMRIRAGRAGAAVELLDRPGSTDGWPLEGPESVAKIRERAAAAVKASSPKAGPQR